MQTNHYFITHPKLKCMKQKLLRYGCLAGVLFILSCEALLAQTTVKGLVTDESGEAMPAVTVKVKGKSQGTSTNLKGEFTLPNVSSADVLVFSSIGYQQKEIPVGNTTTFAVKMDVSTNELEQVVVIGYGTARKKDLVGAADIVNAEDAGATTATSPSQLLVGKAAGVQVLNTNGSPGSGAQIIIRGTGSFTSVEPLYVVDGIQGDGNLFNTLSNQDIETITILKDASATAIYGAAAANGVVIVTTKKAKSGEPRISVTSQFGTAKAWRQLDLLNARDYVDLIRDYAEVVKTPLPAKFNTPDVLVDRTNWQEEIFKSSLVSENNINIAGGSEKVLYNISAGFITQGSTVQDFTNNRLNTRFSLDETIGRFHFGQNLNVRYTKSSGQNANLANTIGYAPYQPIFDVSVPGGYSIVSNVNDLSDVGNPLQPMGVISPRSNEYVFYPQLFAEVSLFKGLSFRSQASGTFGGGSTSSYQIPYTASNNLSYARQANSGFNRYFTYTLENYFSYNNLFGKHSISATAGTSYIDAGNSSSLNALGSNLSNDNVKNISVALNQTVTGAGVGYGTQFGRLISYYGRLIYTFNDKYIVSASVRRDGSSNFGANNRYGNFPGVGIAWKFSEEEFIRNSLPFISDGKLRAGWGRTGNNKFNLGRTDVLTYSGSPNGNVVYSLGSTENFASGTTINGISNPNLQWEETDQTDIGLDLGFLNNTLTFVVDYYDRKSSGLLVNVPLPTSIGVGGVGGVTSSILTNAADAQNKGVEVSVGYNKKATKNLSYNISLNGSYNKNETLSLGSEFQAPIKDGTFNQLNAITYTAKGSPIGSFYGYRVDRVARNQGDIDALNATARSISGNAEASYQNGLLPGDFIFKDLDGNGTVNDADQEILGNPIPKFIYGINIGANFKNFDLNVVTSAVSGVKLVNALKYFTESATTGHNSTTKILNRWRQPGDVAELPRAGQNATGSGNLRPSDFFVEDGSYVRLRNLTLGYSLPAKTLSSFSGKVLSRMRIYLAAQNLFTITDYSGYDPEVSTQSSNGGEAFIFRRGIDDGQLPQPRTFLAGVQLGF